MTTQAQTRPNILYVFGDQWRAQAFGYAGDPNVRTPRIDAFAAQSISFPNAVAGCPVCCPYRASLLTGQYPLSHGVIVNDQSIRGNPVSIADALNAEGYDTAYIGKWHVGGRGRSRFVRPEHRLGFGFWRGCECTHDYNDSIYYADDETPLKWDGYDAEAQTTEAQRWMADHDRTRPFAMFLSWGPPHAPYQTAPQRFRDLYDPAGLTLRENVPPEAQEQARIDLAGYYAHCTALDECFGSLIDFLDEAGLSDNTLVVFASDHGDMLGSRGMWKKQNPYDESVRVPFLMRWPDGLGPGARELSANIDAPDIMPTLLGLCGADIPDTVEGHDFAGYVRGDAPDDKGPALLACYRPFHQWRYDNGGRDYRGLHDEGYTYLRTHDGPWLLFDNQADPCQQRNLVADASAAELVEEMDRILDTRLAALNDAFETGDALAARYGVRMEDGDVAIEK